MADAQFVTGQQTAASSTNKVLRSTYMLLSMSNYDDEEIQIL